MLKNRLFLLCLVLVFFSNELISKKKRVKLDNSVELLPNKDLQENITQEKLKYVYEYTLENGLTVLVRPVHTVPTVSMELWYRVGSKNEHDGERGSAHLLEHMLFKGTNVLSESDIFAITQKLSGYTNAFTDYDYTGYLFDLPSQNWRHGLFILSNCMRNCTIPEDMLSSEMKAVVQELKMYKDHYMRSLMENQISLIFQDHPYHHPVPGYKQDLFNVRSADLLAFYKKHYVPNNAVLVVVGDVTPEEVYQQAQKDFGHIEADWSYKKEEFYFNQDIAATSVNLYRDVAQSQALFTFVVPGARAKKSHLLSLTKLILGQGKSSRLYRKIVEELKLATSLECSSEDLFDHGILFVSVEPNSSDDIQAIGAIISQELVQLAEGGITDQELTDAIKQTKMGFYSLLEKNSSQAHQIGKSFLATGDPEYIFNYLNYSFEELKEGVNQLVREYLRPTIMHTGVLLPLPESEKEEWAKLQKISDANDERIMQGRVRTIPVEPPVYADSVTVGEKKDFNFPKPQTATLSNGLKVFYYHNDNVPKIEIALSLGVRSYADSEELPGLYNFVARMMKEGTKNYTAQEFAYAIESRGMDVAVSPGQITISLLSEDLPFALDILYELLVNVRFNKNEIEKVRNQLKAEIKRFWDEPLSFSSLLVKEKIYKGHPYSKNLLGTIESINNITRKDLVNFYTENINLKGARIAIVGDLQNYDLLQELEDKLGSCEGGAVKPTVFTPLSCGPSCEINYPINRDQVVLCLTKLSVDRKHPYYDKLMLFDQIFGGSSSSRLFDLREETGLFYAINGTLVANADEQPGVMMVKTIVSLDRLAEAEKIIKNCMNTVVDTVTSEELEGAKRAVINSLVKNFSASDRIAGAFLFLDKYSLPADFFDTRATQLASITLDQVKEAAHTLLNQDGLLTVRVGRVSQKQEDEQKEEAQSID